MSTSLIKRPRLSSRGHRGLIDGFRRRKSSRPILTCTLSAACSLLVGWSAFGQGYESNDLTPLGAGTGKFSATAGGRQVGGATPAGSYYTHAIRLRDNALAAVDLNPPNFYTSIATCADETQEGGWGTSNLGGPHAMVWNDADSSYADLHPSGYNFSYCLGVHHGEQVGYAQQQVYFVTTSHAYSWHGSAASGVDLHTGPYAFSRATACRDGEEVGYITTIAYPEGESFGYHTGSHAYRWAGTAASGVDLHPAGFDASEALATSGTQQGGWGYMALGTSHQHALLWSGDAASVVDLHPTAGYTDTRVNAMTATMQVGEGWVGMQGAVGSVRHALAWTGTADSVVDLNQYLPNGYTHGVATGVDSDGFVVGYAYNINSPGAIIPYDAIAVVFAPGKTPPGELASIVLSPANAAPGDLVQGVVALGGPAPAGGLNVTFASSTPALADAPPAVLIPKGETQALFSLPTGGTTLTVPTTFKVYATDGVVSHVAQLTLTPVVKVASFSVNAVEGGFTTYGSLNLNIPAQLGGATFSLASGDTSLASVPASVTVPQGYTSWSFAIGTSPVTVATDVPITATLNGLTSSSTLSLSPAPVVALSGLSIPMMVGGQTVTGTVTVNNFPRNASGATIALSSGDVGSLQVPASVTIPQGATSAAFQVTTNVVSGLKGVSVKATYNGGNLSTTVFVNPPPTVTITQADYLTDTHMFKVAATTSFANSTLTYGTDPTAAPIGTMQFEQGVFKGSIILDTPPAYATVWNSNGGQSTVPVNLKTSSAATGGGGGGGGGGGTATGTAFKVTLKTVGKGSISNTPAGTSFAPGTVVTFTATPAAGAVWNGWSGDVTSTSRSITVTITKALSLTATFK